MTGNRLSVNRFVPFVILFLLQMRRKFQYACITLGNAHNGVYPKLSNNNIAGAWGLFLQIPEHRIRTHTNECRIELTFTSNIYTHTSTYELGAMYLYIVDTGLANEAAQISKYQHEYGGCYVRLTVWLMVYRLFC